MASQLLSSTPRVAVAAASATARRTPAMVTRRAFTCAAQQQQQQQQQHQQIRQFKSTAAMRLPEGTESGHPIAVLNHDILPLLPTHSEVLFAHKKRKNLSFAALGEVLGRDEVAVAAIFYGQAKASPDDIKQLATVLDIPLTTLLNTEIVGYPDRGGTMPCPPKDPLVYRLFEIVQNYGYPFKAVMNEKFGDGIMSAISFSTKVEKEVDDKGEWCKITLRGKWLPYSRF